MKQENTRTNTGVTQNMKLGTDANIQVKLREKKDLPTPGGRLIRENVQVKLINNQAKTGSNTNQIYKV